LNPIDEEAEVSDASGTTENWETILVEQVRRSGRLLFRLAFGILRDAGAAEDLCQQAFMRAWQGRGRMRDPVALQAWLTRVVVNESLQLYRRRQSERRAHAHLGRRGGPVTDGGEALEWRELLHAGLAELSERTRLVVVLRLMEGASGREVKELLGISESEVSRRLHQGMEHLRRRIAAACTVGG
jgi:RNA polymerase sigma-70 factor (ECF subfamily)